jgi:hypothetical protein
VLTGTVATGLVLNGRQHSHPTPATSPTAVPSPTAPAPTGASPTGSGSPAPGGDHADLSLAAGPIITDGSSGSFDGTVRLAVRNHGPATPTRLTLTFTMPSGFTPGPTGWIGCANLPSSKKVSCAEAAPPPGAAEDFAFSFHIDTSKINDIGGVPVTPAVAVEPLGADDSHLSDNNVPLTVCTNGCPSPGFPAVTVTASEATPTVALGGPALVFTVTVANATGRAYGNLSPFVMLDACGCTDSATAPIGTLQLQQPDGTWKTVSYHYSGDGYTGSMADLAQAAPFDLADGDAKTFTYRLRFNATQPKVVHSGLVALDADLLTAPTYALLGNNPATSLLLQVATS